MDNPYTPHIKAGDEHQRPVRYVLQVRNSLATGFTELRTVLPEHVARTRHLIDRQNTALGWRKYRVVTR